jgi:hypothetical protein
MTAILALRTQASAQIGLIELPEGESMVGKRTPKRSSPKPLETAEFRLIFALCFAAFLLEAIASRAMPWRGHVDTLGEQRKSVFAQARAAADRTIPFAFMG